MRHPITRSEANAQTETVTSAVAQESILGLVLFNVFIRGIDRGIESTLGELAGNTE